MKFEDLLGNLWDLHAKNCGLVREQLPDLGKLVQQPEHLSQLFGLAIHVYGEHLGDWSGGMTFLEEFREHPFLTDANQAAWIRARCVLQLGTGVRNDFAELSVSDQIRVLATAASALAAQKQVDRALLTFKEALAKSHAGIGHEDPANRALAVSGNNLACALEENPSQTASETELMIIAAQSARKFWEIAGTWREVLFAEYRLAKTYLQMQSRDLVRSLTHAQKAVELARENNAGAYEFFSAYEALATAEKNRGNLRGFELARVEALQHFENLSADDRTFCESDAKALR